MLIDYLSTMHIVHKKKKNKKIGDETFYFYVNIWHLG